MTDSMTTAVQVADRICTCFPGISTVTNGLQALYRLVHRTDVVARTLIQGEKAEFGREYRIHVLTKDWKELLLGAVPGVGNAFYILKTIIDWILSRFKRDPLQGVIHDTKSLSTEARKEIATLCVENGYLKREGAFEALKNAFYARDMVNTGGVFEVLWNGGDWNAAQMEELLGAAKDLRFFHVGRFEQVLQVYEDRIKAISNKQPISPANRKEILETLKKLVELKEKDLVIRLSKTLESIPFDIVEPLFEGIPSESERPLLRDDAEVTLAAGELSQKEKIELLGRCNECSPKSLMKYCSNILQERRTLVKLKSNEDLKIRGQIFEQFDQLHLPVVQGLVKLVSVQKFLKLFALGDQSRCSDQGIQLISEENRKLAFQIVSAWNSQQLTVEAVPDLMKLIKCWLQNELGDQELDSVINLIPKAPFSAFKEFFQGNVFSSWNYRLYKIDLSTVVSPKVRVLSDAQAKKILAKCIECSDQDFADCLSSVLIRRASLSLTFPSKSTKEIRGIGSQLNTAYRPIIEKLFQLVQDQQRRKNIATLVAASLAKRADLTASLGRVLVEYSSASTEQAPFFRFVQAKLAEATTHSSASSSLSAAGHRAHPRLSAHAIAAEDE